MEERDLLNFLVETQKENDEKKISDGVFSTSSAFVLDNEAHRKGR